MNINWLGNSDSKSAITINENNIVLNKSASEYFKDAYSVCIGIDNDSNNIIIKNLSKEETDNLHSQSYKISFAKSYARICGKSIIDEICSYFKITFNKDNSYKFNAKYNNAEHILICETSILGGEQ